MLGTEIYVCISDHLYSAASMNSRERKPFRKAAKKEALVFDVKKRFEYLNGFSKRKAERKIRGNRKNMKKEILRKKSELETYKNHVQKEFEKAQVAVRHNYGITDDIEDPEESNIIEQQTQYYPVEETADPFGEVSIQITSLESPEFITMRPSAVEQATKDNKCGSEPPKKRTPTFAKFKHMAKSSKFTNRHKKQKDDKSKGPKKVKATVKKTKKAKRFNR